MSGEKPLKVRIILQALSDQTHVEERAWTLLGVTVEYFRIAGQSSRPLPVFCGQGTVCRPAFPQGKAAAVTAL